MPDLRSLRIVAELPCLRCRYVLRGLAADGHCPECGLGLIDSIAARVDPMVAALPPLPRPRTAAWTLLLFVLALCVATSASVASWGAVTANAMAHGWWRDAAHALLPPALAVRLVSIPPIAMSIALLAVLGLIVATGTRGLSRIGLVAGVVLWLATTFLPMSSRALAVMGVPAAITLLAFAPLLGDLGRRCRAYRARTASRQPIGPIESALLVGLSSFAFAEVLQPYVGADATTALRLVAVACVGMTLIGLVYLLWNAVWVWRALSRWQPILERVIDGSPLPAAADGPAVAPSP